MHLLDRETQLQRGEDPDLATCAMTDVYRNFSGVAFGGWTMACAVEALQTHPDFRGQVLTANATFLDGLTEGEIRFRARLLSRKRSTDFWRVEVYADAEESNLAFAVDVVAALERQGEEDYTAPPPVDSKPEDTPVFEVRSGPQWISTFEMRPIKGRPFRDGGEPYSLGWIRDAGGRPLDRKGLAALVDTPLPRIFFIAAVRRFVSTFTLTMTICADDATLAEVGDRPLLIETDSDRIGEGRFHQRTRLWSEKGDIIALSEQVAVYGKPIG